ncbi:MAG: GNAT family N-acetyltransferase [Halothece sp. Uz-M2-17]|nr:GNAT family N-acetyltransferase [Halothece sp. Uz-M2-17]
MTVNAYSSPFPTSSSSVSNHYPTDSFTVRPARLDDLGGITEVLTHSFHSPQGLGILMYPFLKFGIYEDIRSRMCSDRAYYTCLVATAASTGKITGTVELGLNCPEGWIPHQYQSTYISNLAVSSQYRRRGIAQRLLRSCEQVSRQWGFKQIYLHVLDNNEGAQKLYARSGYQQCRVEPSVTAWLFKQPRRVLLGKSMSSHQ